MLYGVKFGGQTDLAFSGHMVFLGLAFWHWESEVIYMSRLFDTTRGRLVGDFFVQVEFVAFQIPRQSGRAGLLWDTYRHFWDTSGGHMCGRRVKGLFWPWDNLQK